MTEQSTGRYRKRALIVAVSDYNDYSKLKRLEFCKKDGEEMYSALSNLGYEIPENRKLIGYVNSSKLREEIIDFFKEGEENDLLVFYYSGHGVPDSRGTIYLAPSDIDSDLPRKRGFSFEDLTKEMLDSSSSRLVTILDSCYSGSLKMGLDAKGGEDEAIRVANKRVSDQSEILESEGQGKCLLAASQSYQQAYNTQGGDHSIFTYFLLEGLKGNKLAVDDEGHVTYESLGKFINHQINKLPFDKRPQLPVRKGELSGDIVLANYPQFKRDIHETKETVREVTQTLPPFKLEEFKILVKEGSTLAYRNKFREALQKFESALTINPSSSTAFSLKSSVLIQMGDYKNAQVAVHSALAIDENNVEALFNKGYILAGAGSYQEAIKYYDKVTELDFKNANAWYEKADCYRRLGKKDEAKESYKIAENLKIR